jgi:hypothetical protein
MTMLKIKRPNHLNIYNVRQPNTAPSYFEYIYIPLQYNLKETISRWILNNLKGRFYVSNSLMYTNNKKIEECLQIGFEDPKELSYFTLACPHLKYY